jgi:hypothetical protein
VIEPHTNSIINDVRKLHIIGLLPFTEPFVRCEFQP